MLFLLLAALGCLMCAALPTDPVFCPIENFPWNITDITVFISNISAIDAAKASAAMGMSMGMAGDTTFTTESFIDFTFRDTNEGLGLTVECSRFTNGTLSDDVNFFACDQKGVVFQYYGGTLEVQRTYKSPCLGKFPFDGAVAFGRANMSFTATTSPNGTVATQTSMEMPITSIT